MPAVDAISSLTYEPDGTEALDHPLEKASERKIIKILNESSRDRRLPTQGELDELSRLMMSPTVPQARSTIAAVSSSVLKTRKKSRKICGNSNTHLSSLTTDTNNNSNRRSSRTASLPKMDYAESVNSDEDFSSENSEEYDGAGSEEDDENYLSESEDDEGKDEDDEGKDEEKEEPSSRKRTAPKKFTEKASTGKRRKQIQWKGDLVSADHSKHALKCI